MQTLPSRPVQHVINQNNDLGGRPAAELRPHLHQNRLQFLLSRTTEQADALQFEQVSVHALDAHFVVHVDENVAVEYLNLLFVEYEDVVSLKVGYVIISYVDQFVE